MDRALASAAAAIALGALILALQSFKLEALGQSMAAVAAGRWEESGGSPVAETPWEQRLLQVQCSCVQGPFSSCLAPSSAQAPRCRRSTTLPVVALC